MPRSERLAAATSRSLHSHTGRPSIDPELMIRMLIIGYSYGIYRARQRDCGACPLKPRCCPNMEFRKITRSIHEAARDVARDIATTEEYQHSRRERKKVEVLFAHLKRILKLDRLRLRGLSGAKDEFILGCRRAESAAHGQVDRARTADCGDRCARLTRKSSD